MPPPSSDLESLKIINTPDPTTTSNFFSPSEHGSDLYEDISDSEDFQNPGVSTESFPQEILIEIFQWLDIRSLDAASLVSRKWHELVANDRVWRAAFVRTYGTSSFGRVTGSLTWKTEMIQRYAYQRSWKKSAGATHVTFKTRLLTVSNHNMYFPAMRLITFSAHSGRGILADPSKGKIATPHLKTNGLADSIETTSTVAISRFGLIYGFLSGKVSGLFFSKGASVRTYVDFDSGHGASITSAWLSQDVFPRNTDLGVVTAAADKTVIIWDAQNGNKKQEFSVNLGNDEDIITYINSDTRNRIILGTERGVVYLWEKDTGKLLQIGKPTAVEIECSYQCDFIGGYVVANNGPTLIRHKITSDADSLESVQLGHPNMDGDSEFLGDFAMDKSPFIDSNASTAPKLVPGGNARYVIAVGLAQAYVWNLRAPPNAEGFIPVIHMVDSPFQYPALMVCVSINSLVFAICSTFGMAFVYNVLTGKKIQLVTVRFPRRILDHGDLLDELGVDDSSCPSRIELDPDPSCPQGIIILNSAVQYFDYGIDASKSKVKAKGIKKKAPGKRKIHSSVPGTPRNEKLIKEIDDDYSIMKEVNRDLAAERRYRQPYVGEGLTEEEQLSYALMLSQDTAAEEDDMVEEMNRRVMLALEQGKPDVFLSAASYDYFDDEEDGDALYQPTGSSSRTQHALSVSKTEMSQEEREIQKALDLSMQENHATSQANSCPDSTYDEDLELALKLSLNKN